MLSIHPSIFEDISFVFCGFGHSRSWLYRLYIASVICAYVLLSASCVYNATILYNQFVFLITDIHLFMALQFVLTVLILRLLHSRPLKEIDEILRDGVFSYDEEELVPMAGQLKRESEAEWNFIVSLFRCLYCTSFCVVMIVCPVLAYLFRDNSDWYTHPTVSMYIPHVFYSPFGIDTAQGLWLSYGVDALVWLVACSTTYSSMKLVLLVMVNLKLHLRLLNGSLGAIEARALGLYRRRSPFSEESFSPPRFQLCLSFCIKQNIRHHHRLVKVKKLFNDFTSQTVTGGISVFAVVAYAFLVYLIAMELPLSMRLKYLCLLVSEGSNTLLVCLWGEDIVSESEELYRNLYRTGWFDFNRELKQLLHIMMEGTMRPMSFNAAIADSALTRECYGNLVKATYSLVNLLGQFDTV